ncbi:class III lanthionine synthetase LanKC [Amycolatopsis magusensis]|uniref:class III lanthionine synthetase LanKC n=1 Tax=Amycolatopsis magusensis TaxID=882444 RepID=UPI0024A99EF8|nr:class III lanthionine synthetase LanKC [Amycolatopsis magusensis]MDI5974606.1 class III lanthionine synthetase LanKC [Amycolatopsis magusensis]
MEWRYFEFCVDGSPYYDKPVEQADGRESFAGAAPVPDGWLSGESGPWRILRPSCGVLPAQGWKVHVSSTPAEAERVLRTTHAYCAGRGLTYKHLRSARVLSWSNRKYAPRSSSGKFLTIYPPDEQSLRAVLEDLSAELAGVQGPYILSDLRYGAGPLYTRYGSFTAQWADDRTLGLTRPDGVVVPDQRTPWFEVPEWISLPAFLEPHLEARRSTGAALPYQVTEALHFSNAGGVYRATRHSDGTPVILKEARPHAGLDARGRHAVERLLHERDMLQRLAGIPGIPAVHDHFVAGDHHFLALAEMPGIRLNQWLGTHYPLTRVAPAEHDVRAYTEQALDLSRRVAHLIEQVHARGVVMGDLHPGNILIDESGALSLIDFETASDALKPTRQLMAAPGFRAPRGLRGTEVDQHALAMLRLWFFAPLTNLLEVAPAKLADWVAYAEQRFDLPSHFGSAVLGVPEPRDRRSTRASWPAEPGPEDWPALRTSIVDGILASATPGRTDRLFPGDINQFETGGTGFAHGAAGVLYALDVAGAGREPQHEAWLLDAIRRTPPDRSGFFDGGHGIAYVLDHLGYHEEAAVLLKTSMPWEDHNDRPGIGSGLAGIGLTHLHLGAQHDDEARIAHAAAVGRRLVTLLSQTNTQVSAGFEDGWSGAALLFARLYEVTGAPSWLEHADRALRRDLAGCVPVPGDALQVKDAETGALLPYLAAGSAGVALAAAELATHHPDAPAVARLPELVRGCESDFTVHPGLLRGRAGLILTLASAGRGTDAALARHLSGLGLHAVTRDGTTCFPGHQLLRLSADLATGSAGILLALHAALGDAPVTALPFPPRHARVPAGTP